ncbi:MAG: hypothetical protein HYV07_22640 [Deltaproteobacteria bacterium]|nr:hypothetical protein [Deltaproteobacteria bacterium]
MRLGAAVDLRCRTRASTVLAGCFLASCTHSKDPLLISLPASEGVVTWLLALESGGERLLFATAGGSLSLELDEDPSRILGFGFRCRSLDKLGLQSLSGNNVRARGPLRAPDVVFDWDGTSWVSRSEVEGSIAIDFGLEFIDRTECSTASFEVETVATSTSLLLFAEPVGSLGVLMGLEGGDLVFIEPAGEARDLPKVPGLLAAASDCSGRVILATLEPPLELALSELHLDEPAQRTRLPGSFTLPSNPEDCTRRVPWVRMKSTCAGDVIYAVGNEDSWIARYDSTEASAHWTLLTEGIADCRGSGRPMAFDSSDELFALPALGTAGEVWTFARTATTPTREEMPDPSNVHGVAWVPGHGFIAGNGQGAVAHRSDRGSWELLPGFETRQGGTGIYYLHPYGENFVFMNGSGQLREYASGHGICETPIFQDVGPVFELATLGDGFLAITEVGLSSGPAAFRLRRVDEECTPHHR